MASLPEKYKEVNSNVEVTYENFPEEDYMALSSPPPLPRIPARMCSS